MNAVVASGVEAREYAQLADSLWLDFTKGLGAPLGSVLAGSRYFIDQANRWRQMFGGGLCQAGFCAAACIYGLEKNVARLADDHENAKLLVEGLASLEGVVAYPDHVETNLVFVKISEGQPSSDVILTRLMEKNIRIGAMGGPGVLRLVTHLGITRSQVAEVLTAFADVLEDK